MKNSSNPDIITQIRLQTRSLHEQLENTTEGHKFFEGTFDRSHYIRFLQSHYLFHMEIARHVGACDSMNTNSILDWPNCERISALKTDLKSLGFERHEMGGGVSDRLTVHSSGFAAGLVYVSEGSSLGNQQIYKALSKKEAFLELGAKQFFEVSIKGPSERWKAFLHLLSLRPVSQHEAIVEGAKKGFQYFGQLYSKLQEVYA